MRYFIEHVPKVTNPVTGYGYKATRPYRVVMINQYKVKTTVRIYATHGEAQAELTTLRLEGVQST